MNSYRKWRVFCISVFLLEFLWISCSWKPITPLQQSVGQEIDNLRRNSRSSDLTSDQYIPWEGHSSIFPTRTIRVNFHFMNSRDGDKNLSGTDASRFATELVALANKELADNQPMRLPLGNQTPVLDPLLQYTIAETENGRPAIYEHFDDDFYYLVKKGPYRNNYDRKVIERYGVGLDSILNVFVQVTPPDSMMGNNYGGLKNGVALRNAIRISGPLLEDARVYAYSGMFNHEVGHILRLRHSWVRDQCEDTPEHPNCWNFTQNGSVCDSLVSNNVMDSNADQDALTPCQIGIIQQNLTEISGKGRNFQVDSYCLSRDVPPIRIQDTVIWNREVDVVSDIILENNSKLVVKNRLSMPEGSRIYVGRKAQLVLGQNAYIRNACELHWEGIFSKSGSKDQIVLEQGAVIHLDEQLSDSQ